MSCFRSMFKYLFFLCNFLFFVTGCVITGFGAFTHFKVKTYFDFVDNTYINSAIVFIVIGVVIAFVSFLGCCGTCTESSCMLYTFASIMGIILAVEVGVVVAVFIFKADALAVTSRSMKNGLANYHPGDAQFAGVTGTWDVLQHDLHCCGVDSYTDWAPTDFSRNQDVPDSCCVNEQTGCGKGALIASNEPIYRNGCLKTFLSMIEGNATVAIGIGLGVGLVQLFTIILSCSLGQRMSSRLNYV